MPFSSGGNIRNANGAPPVVDDGDGALVVVVVVVVVIIVDDSRPLVNSNEKRNNGRTIIIILRSLVTVVVVVIMVLFLFTKINDASTHPHLDTITFFAIVDILLHCSVKKNLRGSDPHDSSLVRTMYRVGK